MFYAVRVGLPTRLVSRVGGSGFAGGRREGTARESSRSPAQAKILLGFSNKAVLSVGIFKRVRGKDLEV